MAKNSRKLKSLKVIQGGKSERPRSTRLLTHEDIDEFFAMFAEAILVDQERVNKLPHDEFHALYDDGMWQRNREDHVGAIVGLSMTVDEMPKSLLTKLTEFAVAYRPAAVKQSLLNKVSDLATGVASPWLYETASLLFSELIADVSKQHPGISSGSDPLEMLSKWFDYDDPIAIASDPECEYADLLASQVQRESMKARRALASRGRSAFMEMRAAREFCNQMLS